MHARVRTHKLAFRSPSDKHQFISKFRRKAAPRTYLAPKTSIVLRQNVVYQHFGVSEIQPSHFVHRNVHPVGMSKAGKMQLASKTLKHFNQSFGRKLWLGRYGWLSTTWTPRKQRCTRCSPFSFRHLDDKLLTSTIFNNLFYEYDCRFLSQGIEMILSALSLKWVISEAVSNITSFDKCQSDN